ncbi:MAG TPA: hypothetical protein VES97_00025 [Solirubrobacteraceae bacterium]|nr:hypothetical protein [Solirubrobacteraceae bacterium]
MTPVECAAMRDVEVAEQAVRDAIAALETAHERLEVIMRREHRRELVKAGAHLHLRLVVGTRQ